MYNLPFAIWILGWPVIALLEDFLYLHIMDKDFSIIVAGISAFIYVVLWVYIGKLLYVPHKFVHELIRRH